MDYRRKSDCNLYKKTNNIKHNNINVVDIVESENEICSERENHEMMNKQSNDEDLFFFDISGNRFSPKYIENHKLIENSEENIEINQSNSVSPNLLRPKINKNNKKTSSISSNSDIFIEKSTKSDEIFLEDVKIVEKDIKSLKEKDFSDKESSKIRASKLNIDDSSEEYHLKKKKKNNESKNIHKRKKKTVLSKAYISDDEVDKNLKKRSYLDMYSTENLNRDKYNCKEEEYKLSVEDVFKICEKDVVKQWEENILNVSQEINDDEKDALCNLHITLPFDDIPPLHNISRPSKPTTEETERCKLLNAKMGPFSKLEDEQIKENWENFRKEHHLELEPSVFFKFHRCMKQNEKKKFMLYLSYKLNDRHPFNVHCRFQRLYTDKNIKSGRFTDKEDKKILEFMRSGKSTAPFRDLGILLRRSANAVQRRYFVLESSFRDTRIGWNMDLRKKLIEGMLKVTGKEHVKDLENVILTASQWRELSHLVNDIPANKLYGTWYTNVHPKLFMREDIKEVKRDLVKMMLINKEKDYRTVNWKKYADNFSGVNEWKLYEIFANMVKYHVPLNKRSDLRSTIKCLSKRQTKSSKMYRYIYENGDLKKEEM